jgi:hypothetical protein
MESWKGCPDADLHTKLAGNRALDEQVLHGSQVSNVMICFIDARYEVKTMDIYGKILSSMLGGWRYYPL